MLLTIATSRTPATDLGYLLHKNPARVHVRELSFGAVSVFYPEATESRCEAAMLVEVDPIGLMRQKAGRSPFQLLPYVNDRPYAASSFLCVAIAEMFGTAMNGRCKDRPDLVDVPFELEVFLPVLPVGENAENLQRVFEPLGYQIEARQLPLDEHFPEWGQSRYFEVRLRVTSTVQDLLNQLYVLIPVLDRAKHYWVGEEEINKLMAKGGRWLAEHPEKEFISARYLKYRRPFIQEALSRLEATIAVVEDETEAELEVVSEEPRPQLHAQRLEAAARVLQEHKVESVIDLGCGEGRLLEILIREMPGARLAGMDVSSRALARAEDRLRLDRLSENRRARITLFQGSLLYRDARIAGYDAACLIEVIEHLEESRLRTLERVVFGAARPQLVIVTTPNHEFNVRYAALSDETYRHADHRFEWNRAQFAAWSESIVLKYGYTSQLSGIGEEDLEVGAPSQMAVFVRSEKEAVQ